MTTKIELRASEAMAVLQLGIAQTYRTFDQHHALYALADEASAEGEDLTVLVSGTWLTKPCPGCNDVIAAHETSDIDDLCSSCYEDSAHE